MQSQRIRNTLSVKNLSNNVDEITDGFQDAPEINFSVSNVISELQQANVLLANCN